ncbi:MAG: DNA polymerase III subunit delta [Ruminococcaceae bacterium]|nr:DNA polymerase III subunit delta [Oscillospiraceae bacterium]
MAAIGEDVLKLHIKDAKFSSAYIFYGEDDFMKRFYLDKIKAKAVGDNLPEFNLHVLDGTKAGIDEILELAMSIPMMSDYVLVIVNDFDFSSVSDEKIEELFASLGEGIIMLFYSQTVKPNMQKGAWKKAMKLFKEKGSSVKFEKKDARELAKIAMSAAKKRGCYFPQYLAASFVERVGNDLFLIKNEVEKLCAMKGEGEITAADIDAITVKTLDASAFDLTKALISGNPNKAFDILNDLKQQREEAIMILGAINSSYIDMYRVKVASQKGLEPAAVANFYSYNKADWKLKRAAFNAKNLSVSQLRRSINVLCDADEKLKSVNNDATVVLDETLVKLMLIAARSQQ